MRLPRCSLLLALACLLTALPGAAHAQDGRIIHGNPNAEKLVIPWQVGLVPRTADGVTSAVFCGGTVRDATHVITAAHCLPNRGAADVAVLAGVADRSAASLEDIYYVESITTHPSYDTPDQANDIAILTLAQPMPLGGAIAPLPPVGVGSNDAGEQALISGWGDIDISPDNAQSPPVVRYAFIDILADSGCANYDTLFLAGNMLCAGRTVVIDEQSFTIDTCQGDSGGPLARWDDANGDDSASLNEFDALLGVVSFGRGCADPEYPGIYAKVASPDLNARLTDENPPPRTEPTGEPGISGEIKATRTIACEPGQWTQSPTFQFRWMTAKIEGEQASDFQQVGVGESYSLRAEDVDRAVFCVVRASGPGGYRTAQSPGYIVAGAPADPGPTDPGPTDPGPANPGPANPGPANPGPVTPGPSNPGPAIQPRDLLAPVAGITRRNCAKRVCKLTIIASDAGGVATGLTATVARVSGCKKGKKGAKCRKAKTLKVSAKGSGVFEIKTGKLKRARYKFTVVATDAAGNRSKAESVTLKLK